MLKGGCFCGRIRYEAAGLTSHETICHCSICRRTSGAPFVAWFMVPREEFRFVRGEPRRFESTAEASRCFCAQCGTQLTFEHRDFPDEIDITTCSLDDPDASAPKDQIWTSARLRWIKLGDQLPEYAENRDA